MTPRLTIARVSSLLVAASLGLTFAACSDPEPEIVERICVAVTEPITLNAGVFGHKPKIQRTSNGNLIVIYGDVPDASKIVFDVKGDVERPARDIFVRTCMPSEGTSCNLATDWSEPVNLSQAAELSSMDVAWQGGDPVDNRMPFWGDADKPNVKTAGTALVLTWTSKYCPDGDPSTAEVDAPVQRAVRYLERGNRVVPFSCTWVAQSVNNGVTWSAPQQLSDGQRDAKQDASRGTFNSETKQVQWAISWQEDPLGLQLGEGDGPGDGASGASVSGGTDVWYAQTTHNITGPNDNAFAWSAAYRLTDNFQGKFGIAGQVNPIFDADGVNVPEDMVEKGQAGASRPNIGKVGKTVIVAYEETKGSEGLDEGKFIRYHTFDYNAPPSDPEGQAGCVISDPARNARRVRFVHQSAADAGPGGIQLGIFWKEGVADHGGPSDIVVRRGIDGLAAANMVPAVDPGCATSVYEEAIALTSERAENLSSMSTTATLDNLNDDTEANDEENALAHRGVLRGRDLWVGYTYSEDLVALWAQLNNYDFFIRRYNVDDGAWTLPLNVSNIEDTGINVREPRLFATPKGTDACANDPAFCQNTDVVYVAYGTQVNESSPFDEGPDDLGIYITVSDDRGETFGEPQRLSTAMGIYFADDENAYESQLVTRPDGQRFYGVWANNHLDTGDNHVEYISGDLFTVEGEGVTCEMPASE
ncbi:MAG: hypothetical protein KC486_01450 [Myxococcales bacterium]|nr:hypothetical protein [Myxococcales bacterium]